MNKIADRMRIVYKLAVLAVAACWCAGLTATESGTAEPAERTYHIVYHDDYRNIIRRDPYTSGYTFDAQDPFFWVAMPVTNIAWCTIPTENGQQPMGATVYNTGYVLSTPLTEDLHVYPVTSFGTFVRFDSDGGAPFHYQFVQVGNHATNPGTPSKTGYTFDGWYQVLMDAEGHETGLATTQFDFNSWTPVKTTTQDPTKEIVLRAKWAATNVEYKVHIWLEKAEHLDRESAADALAHFLDDYTYGGTITKTGLSDGNVSFDPASESTANKNYINSLIQFKPTNTLTYTLYYYDNEDGSLAKAMSEQEITTINSAGGIQADGSTAVNVFYRRMRYNAHIGYSTNATYNNVGTVQCAVDFPIRFEETIESALARHNKTVTSPLSGLMNENTFNSNAYWALTYMEGWIWGFQDEYPEGGMNASIFPSPVDIYNDMEEPTAFIDGVDVYSYFVNVEMNGYKYVRQIYLQNLASAGTTISDTDLNTLTKFTKHSQQNWIEGDAGPSVFFPYQYEGFTIYKRQIVKDNDRNTYYNDNQNDINGRPIEYSQSTNSYPYYSRSDGTSVQNWQVELFYSRNHHSIAFETFTNRVTVTHNDKFDYVYYEQPLSVISSDIKYYGTTFVVGETYYEDDQGAKYIFQGWYDNAAFEGDPVDFASYLMPDHNVMLYAKWEKQMIEITFDADGGKIQGGGTYVMQIASGQIPYMNDEPVSPDPGRIAFFSWTSEGVYYEFLDPFYKNATLVAMYYANPAEPFKITYKAGQGTGDDVTEFADYGYVYNANAGVLDFFPDWTVAKGKIFKHWEDKDGNTYEPYDEIYMKHDVTLTTVYEGGHADIVINREGLLEDETAIFDVFRMVDEVKTFVMRVSLTGTDSEGATVSRKLLNMEPGEYVVEETEWSWAYEKGTTTVKNGTDETTSSVNGTGTGTVAYEETLEFTFTGAPLANVTKHAEDAKVNQFSKEEQL